MSDYRQQQAPSQRIVVQAPFSFTGSAKRLWQPIGRVQNPIGQVVAGLLMATVIFFVWSMIACWYMIFGIFVIPYRLLRRGQRQRRKDAARMNEHYSGFYQQQVDWKTEQRRRRYAEKHANDKAPPTR